MITIHPIIKGSNQPIAVALSDAATDTAIPLTGCTGISAIAKHAVTGTVAAFNAAVITDAANGKLRLDYGTATFAETGLWDVQINGLDAAGNALTMPSEEGQLKIRVGEKIIP